VSTTLVRRPGRVPVQPVPDGEVTVTAPPTGLAKAGGPGAFQMLMPILGSGGGMVMMLSNPNPMLVLSGSLMAGLGVVSGVGMVVQRRRQSRRQADTTRRRYVAHLVGLRHQVQAAADAQQKAEGWRHPRPDDLWRVAVYPRRLWERRPADDDFLVVRVGLGRTPLHLRPKLQTGSQLVLADPDPVCSAAALRLVRRWSTIDGQPLAVPLREVRTLSIQGERTRVAGCARALVAQSAAFHAPDDLQVAIAAAPDRLAEWEWCKWLPHVASPDLDDDSGAGRLVGGSFEEFELAAHHTLASRRGGRADAGAPHLLVVVDGLSGDPRLARLLGEAAGPGVTAVHLAERPQEEPDDVDGRIVVAPDGLMTVNAAGVAGAGRADDLSPALADNLARRLAPLRLSADSGGRALAATVDVTDLLGLGDVAAIDTTVTWKRRSTADFLNVPFGVGPRGEPVRLDLKESALGGHGPHGLMIGATGSGKSELLRSLLAALAATHPPDELAMVLVDFKGGAAFAGLADLPHVAGMITNLSDDLGLVDRMRDALVGEQRRRQELLAAAGNLANVREYRVLRDRRRPDLEPLPNLLVVIDEFSELLSQKPEFIEVFVAIGRLGRSLGIHLLFSSQRLEEGRLRGLESHLSYRLGLRTFSAMESRAVLGVPDAYELPPVPGSGYLKVDTSVWQRFRAALVSGPYQPPSAGADHPDERPRPAPFPAVTVIGGSPASAASGGTGDVRPEDSDGPSILDVLVDRLKGAADKVHQVWVDPLPAGVGLDLLVGNLEPTTERGLAPVAFPGAGHLRAPIGVVDRPLEQRVDVLVHDFSRAAGNLVVAGGPQSGRTTMLRTIMAGLALTHTPKEVAVHAVDLGGGGLRALAELPHVGTVAGRLEPDLVRRVVAEVHSQLRKREELFAARNIDSAADFRARRARGELDGERYGDLFLVLDGWPAFKQNFENLEPAVLDIAARGLGYAIHLVLSVGRWMDMRLSLKEAMGGRFELRLNDPVESEIDRKVAQTIATAGPGRGLTRDKLAFQVALPRIDGDDDAATLPTGLDDFVRRVADAWVGDRIPPVRLLPDVIKADELPMPGRDTEPGVPIGLGEGDLEPVYLELTGNEGHLVVLGDTQTGKSSFLRTYAQGLSARKAPDEAQVLVVDYRRALLEIVPPSHLRGYAGSAVATQTEAARLREELVSRLPGADLTPAELRARSWWSGPEIYVLVDDYDLVVTPSGNPLAALAELLPQARDVGLHLLLARRAGGVSRALFEPVLQRVRELGSPHLLLSGDPNEGPIAGPFRLTPQPPGRGVLVRRNDGLLVQTAFAPEADAMPNR
jgi:DNA segregation ATPase FtsK/SpoIIIE, S-DNA-T family